MKKIIISLYLLLLPVNGISQPLSYDIIYSRDSDKSYWRYIVFDNIYDYSKVINKLFQEFKTRGFTKICFSEEYHCLSAEKELALNVVFTFVVYDSNHSPLLTQPKNTIGFSAHIFVADFCNYPEDIRVYARNHIPELQEELLSVLQPCKRTLNHN